LESFLGGMLTTAPSEKTPAQKAPSPICDVCGYQYQQLQEKGRLGCPGCYRAFREHLLPMLRRYHGGVHHLGKVPRSLGPRTALRREISQMKLLLEQAVAQESYEEAAKIRDEIRLKEKQIEVLSAGAVDGQATDPDEVDSSDLPSTETQD
jgi:protein arginine kinase activator